MSIRGIDDDISRDVVSREINSSIDTPRPTSAVRTATEVGTLREKWFQTINQNVPTAGSASNK